MNTTTHSLLIIDDEENMRHMLKAMVGRHGYKVETAADGQEALGLVSQQHYTFILCDVRMPGMDGPAFLAAGKEYLRDSTVIMMSAYGSIETAIEAMKAGAYDFISKPFKADEVLLTLKKAEEREALKRENLRLKEELQEMRGSGGFGRIISKSSIMQALLKLAAKVALYDTTVLITGESGTGKELMARGIHDASPRAARAFTPINCGGIPENLLESEFFGYLKGAFTGADRAKKGLFEESDGGTVFLDEIGELPLALQVKLLRVLQEREVRPLGSHITRKINVRVLAATSRNLAEDVQQGKFREDLYFRLNVINIHIPPLRERIDDIPLLCQYFLEKLRRNLGKDVHGLSQEVLRVFFAYSWPGNVRELENVLERAVVLADKKVILPENLSPGFVNQQNGRRVDDFFDGFSIKQAQKTMEKALIGRALQATDGNKSKASDLLEISYPSLLNKIKEYEIDLSA